jgi:glycosyltransferase involved in cell wall biosynthesis
MYLANQDYPKDKYEIIVVDDGSTDGTETLMETISYPQSTIRYIKQDRLGPHIARNRGIREAQGEVILFIDSDVFCPRSVLSAHLRRHNEEDSIIVSGPVVKTDKLHEDFRDIRKRRFRKYFDLSGPSLITSNLSVKKKHLLMVGGFSDEFKGYGWHDWELGLRLKQAGLKTKRDLGALAYHFNEDRQLTLVERLKKRRSRGRNAVCFLSLHPTLRVILSIHLHFIFYDMLIRLLLKKRGFRRAFPKLSTKWFLIHAYTKGLRIGFKEYRGRLRKILRDLKWT